MDNASFHCMPGVKEAIEAAGCQVKYLPPYSPDFNPIELSFSVLKAWVRRFFQEMWPQFGGSFGDFLRHAIQRSRCDRFAVKHFRYSTYGRIVFEADVQEFNRQLVEQGVEDYDD